METKGKGVEKNKGQCVMRSRRVRVGETTSNKVIEGKKGWGRIVAGWKAEGSFIYRKEFGVGRGNEVQKGLWRGCGRELVGGKERNVGQRFKWSR